MKLPAVGAVGLRPQLNGPAEPAHAGQERPCYHILKPGSGPAPSGGGTFINMRPLGPWLVVVATTGLLLALFVLAALLLGGARRRRLVSRQEPRAPSIPDAWTEAGRRMPVPPRGTGQGPGSGAR